MCSISSRTPYQMSIARALSSQAIDKSQPSSNHWDHTFAILLDRGQNLTFYKKNPKVWKNANWPFTFKICSLLYASVIGSKSHKLNSIWLWARFAFKPSHKKVQLWSQYGFDFGDSSLISLNISPNIFSKTQWLNTWHVNTQLGGLIPRFSVPILA